MVVGGWLATGQKVWLLGIFLFIYSIKLISFHLNTSFCSFFLVWLIGTTTSQMIGKGIILMERIVQEWGKRWNLWSEQLVWCFLQRGSQKYLWESRNNWITFKVVGFLKIKLKTKSCDFFKCILLLYFIAAAKMSPHFTFIRLVFNK